MRAFSVSLSGLGPAFGPDAHSHARAAVQTFFAGYARSDSRDDAEPGGAGPGQLLVWIATPLGLRLGRIAVSLGAARSLVSFIQVSPSRVAPLVPALLRSTHRHGHQEHHEHDRDRDDDHDDTCADREHVDEGDGHVSSPPLSAQEDVSSA